MRQRGHLMLSTLACLWALGWVAGPAQASAGPCGTFAWCNRSLTPGQRANLLLAAMTQQEKVDFLGGDDFEGGISSGPHIHTGTQDGVPRLGVPTVYYADGPLGPRQGTSIGLPAPLGLAAAFDPSLARRYGAVVGEEDRAKGNEVAFGPTINIMRTPLGGRTYEAYGEDPFLTAQTAVGWIDGLQSQGVLADVKHFAENNQEGEDPTGKTNNGSKPIGVATIGSRYVVNVHIDDRTLHEIELFGFQAAIQQAHAATVMCAYNHVNGAYSCQNYRLLERILRDEWGFRGYVLADYGAAHDTIGSMKGGLDFEPWPPAAYKPAEIDAALASGRVTEQELNQHVRNVLVTWFRYGLFDRRPYPDTDRIDWGHDGRVATQVEEQAVTLLRNRRGLLPLSPRIGRVAVIGQAANTFVTGGGSGHITPRRTVTLLAGIRGQVSRRTVVTYDDGRNVSRAVADARRANVAIVAASDYYTEGADRSCLTLECPDNFGNQDGLVQSVAAANPHTVVVLESGGPDLTPWRRRVAGLLEAWYPGGLGGRAVARVLFGRASPGGRLPVTFPAATNQIPEFGDTAAYPGVENQVYYKEGVLVGYRWYQAKRERPAYPFGFGLSYTSFRMTGLTVHHAPEGAGGLRVRLTVTNTGHRPGWAVPEVYVHVLAPRSLTAPPVQLKGFSKLWLRPGQRRVATVPLDSRSLSYWNTAVQAWRIQPGCYTIYAGSSSASLPLRRTISRGGARC
jgi:beta-glucosidase